MPFLLKTVHTVFTPFVQYGATQAEPTSAASPVLLLVAQLMSTYASR